MRHARDLLDVHAQGRVASRQRLITEIMIKSDRQSRIVRRTAMSAATVSTLVQELANAGIVESDKVSGRSTGGPIRLLPLQGIAVGVDLGFNHMSVVARRVDQSSERVVKRRAGPGANAGLRLLYKELRHLVTEAVGETGQAVDDIVSVGLAVPRMVDPRTGGFAEPVLPPWDVQDNPAEVIGEMLGRPVVMDNDANLGAMAEQTYGADEPLEHVVYVKASTGVGVGIMVGSTLLRGQRGMAGEIGHLTMAPDGDMCLCGGRGCLDTIVGAGSLVANVRQAQRGTSRDVPTDLAALVQNARKGDPVCVRVLNDAGRMLGLALAQLCNLINPRSIVVGGELAEAGQLLLGPCEQELVRHALAGTVSTGTAAGFELRASALNPYTEAQGALILGLRSRASH